MLQTSHDRPIEILLVEDSRGDVELTLEALEETRVPNNVTVMNDGEAALVYLDQAMIGNGRVPDMILLDLNLPRVDGREVLGHLKQSSELSRIPVVVLSTSKADGDVLGSYEGHANSFVTKPMHADAFVSAVRAVGDYWLSVVTLPPRVVFAPEAGNRQVES